MNFLGCLLALVILGVGYGYADAWIERRATTTVYGSVVNPWSVSLDTLEASQPFESGQLFVMVEWGRPSPETLVSSIRIKGTVEDSGQTLSSFDGPCLRDGRAWLAETSLSSCFLKLDMIVKTPEGKEPNWGEAHALIANMKVKFSAEAKVANVPMRYITWINGSITWIDESLRRLLDFVSIPFERS